MADAPANPPVVFDANSARRIGNAVRKVETVDLNGPAECSRGPAGRTFWAKITAYHDIDGAANRWAYDWVEQRRIKLGWEPLPAGRSSTEKTRALNGVEANNDGEGVEGNSIDVDTLGEDGEILPVQGDPVVQMHVDFYKDEDGQWQVAYQFQYENAWTTASEPPPPPPPTYTTNLTRLGKDGNTIHVYIDDAVYNDFGSYSPGPTDVVVTSTEYYPSYIAYEGPGSIALVFNEGEAPEAGDTIEFNVLSGDVFLEDWGLTLPVTSPEIEPTP